VRVRAKEWGKVAGRGLCISGATRDSRFFLITVFPKNEKENLSMQSANALQKRADSISRLMGANMKTQFEQMIVA